MASGHYPLPTREPAGARLAKIADDLKAALASISTYSTGDDLPAATDNDEFDNAASDGAHVAMLRLAHSLIERAVDRSN